MTIKDYAIVDEKIHIKLMILTKNIPDIDFIISDTKYIFDKIKWS